MLRRQQLRRTRIKKLLDASLFALSYWLAHWIRSQFDSLAKFGGQEGIGPFADYAWLLVIIVPIGPLLLELQGFYSRPLIASRKRAFWQVFKACAICMVVVISVLFVTNATLSRAMGGFFGAISVVLLMAKEEVIRRWMESRLGREQFKKRLILVGTLADTRKVQEHLRQVSSDEIEVLAELNLNETPVEKLVDLLHLHSANGVILSAKHTYFGQIEKAIQACELEGVEAWLLADFFNTQLSQTVLDDFYGRPTVVFRSTPEDSWQAVAKQALDVAGALLLIVILSPVMLACAIGIRISSPGPVLFKQERSGLNGRPFTMLKFRSMVTNAEQRKHELAILNEMTGPVFKISNDPRVTAIGRFMRKYSLDELPQLINVLRGEMSLVGPRPLPVDETARFSEFAHRRRLSVKPGLTCLWQISGRNNLTDFKEWVRLDLEYIDNWSFWLDLKILIRTIPVVFMGTGAK